jgi:hypothetical protein
MTCPRPPGQADSLHATLRALDGAGAGDLASKVVFSDGPLPGAEIVTAPGRRPWLVREHADGPSGTIPALLRMWRGALALGADALLMFEDDVLPCRNAVHRMVRHGVPDDCALASFLDMNRMPEGTEEGLYRVTGHGFSTPTTTPFWGHQALLVPRRTLQEVAALSPEATAEMVHRFGLGSDCMLGHLMATGAISRPSYGVHVPSLVQHVGAQSRVNPESRDHVRPARNFPGADFDALTLGQNIFDETAT